METVKQASSICLDYGWRIHADETQTGEAQGWYNGFPAAGCPPPCRARARRSAGIR